MGTRRTKETLFGLGTRFTSGVLLTGFGRFGCGGRLTSLEYLAFGDRGARGALRAILEDGTNGALLKEA